MKACKMCGDPIPKRSKLYHGEQVFCSTRCGKAYHNGSAVEVFLKNRMAMRHEENRADPVLERTLLQDILCGR